MNKNNEDTLKVLPFHTSVEPTIDYQSILNGMSPEDKRIAANKLLDEYTAYLKTKLSNQLGIHSNLTLTHTGLIDYMNSKIKDLK